MPNPVSPLQLIHQKETMVRKRLQETQLQAEARVQAARAEAKALLVQADQAGRLEAQALYQGGLDEAQREAAAMLVASQEEARLLCQRVTTRLDQASARIVQLILP
jgi:vacuolar-type H+-ATPase subunit H